MIDKSFALNLCLYPSEGQTSRPLLVTFLIASLFYLFRVNITPYRLLRFPSFLFTENVLRKTPLKLKHFLGKHVPISSQFAVPHFGGPAFLSVRTPSKPHSTPLRTAHKINTDFILLHWFLQFSLLTKFTHKTNRILHNKECFFKVSS